MIKLPFDKIAILSRPLPHNHQHGGWSEFPPSPIDFEEKLPWFLGDVRYPALKPEELGADLLDEM
jgi:hypothetical protein